MAWLCVFIKNRCGALICISLLFYLYSTFPQSRRAAVSMAPLGWLSSLNLTGRYLLLLFTGLTQLEQKSILESVPVDFGRSVFPCRKGALFCESSIFFWSATEDSEDGLQRKRHFYIRPSEETRAAAAPPSVHSVICSPRSQPESDQTIAPLSVQKPPSAGEGPPCFFFFLHLSRGQHALLDDVSPPAPLQRSMPTACIIPIDRSRHHRHSQQLRGGASSPARTDSWGMI